MIGPDGMRGIALFEIKVFKKLVNLWHMIPQLYNKYNEFFVKFVAPVNEKLLVILFLLEALNISCMQNLLTPLY